MADVVIKNFPLADYNAMLEEITKLKETKAKLTEQLAGVERVVADEISKKVKEGSPYTMYSEVYVTDIVRAMGLDIGLMIESFEELYASEENDTAEENKADEGYQE